MRTPHSETRRGSRLLRGLAALILLGSPVAGPAAAPRVKATLNGADLEFDGDTGALLTRAAPSTCGRPESNFLSVVARTRWGAGVAQFCR